MHPEASDRAFCQAMLPRVSRTFALCIRFLPPGLDYAVLFPTGAGNVAKLREVGFATAIARATNDLFAREYNRHSPRVQVVDDEDVAV